MSSSTVGGLVEDWNQSVNGEPKASPIVYYGAVYEGTGGSSSDQFSAFDATSGQVLWSYPLDTNADAAAANGIVYVGSNQLYAFHAKTGQVLWTASTGGAFLSPPVIASGGVYVGGYNDILYAFNAQTGAAIWSAKTGGSF